MHNGIVDARNLLQQSQRARSQLVQTANSELYGNPTQGSFLNLPGTIFASLPTTSKKAEDVSKTTLPYS